MRWFEAVYPCRHVLDLSFEISGIELVDRNDEQRQNEQILPDSKKKTPQNIDLRNPGRARPP